MAIEQINGGIHYIDTAVAAIPEKNFFYQIALLRWMLRVTRAAHAFELAQKPENPPELPIDPHGFPPLFHMLGSVQVANERYIAEQAFRKRKAEALLDTMMNADPAVISAAGNALKDGQLAEQKLIELVAVLKPEVREYIATLTPTKHGLRQVPISVDPNSPAVLETVNTRNPFNNGAVSIEYEGWNKASADIYVTSPSTRARIKYLPPLEANKRGERKGVTEKMSKGALLVLRGENGSGQTQKDPLLHLFNTEFDLRSFAHPKSTSDDRNHYLYNLDAQSTYRNPNDYYTSRSELPLFTLVASFPPELVERLAMVDLRDITSEEQVAFYSALNAINRLCDDIERQFDQYVAQTIGDQQMTEFLTGTVAKTIEGIFASLTNERLKNELKVGYAAIMTRIRTEKGLIKPAPSKTMHIQYAPEKPSQKGPGLWDKFRKALS